MDKQQKGKFRACTQAAPSCKRRIINATTSD